MSPSNLDRSCELPLWRGPHSDPMIVGAEFEPRVTNGKTTARQWWSARRRRTALVDLDEIGETIETAGRAGLLPTPLARRQHGFGRDSRWEKWSGLHPRERAQMLNDDVTAGRAHPKWIGGLLGNAV